jgi:hypothetical protein
MAICLGLQTAVAPCVAQPARPCMSEEERADVVRTQPPYGVSYFPEHGDVCDWECPSLAACNATLVEARGMGEGDLYVHVRAAQDHDAVPWNVAQGWRLLGVAQDRLIPVLDDPIDMEARDRLVERMRSPGNIARLVLELPVLGWPRVARVSLRSLAPRAGALRDPAAVWASSSAASSSSSGSSSSSSAASSETFCWFPVSRSATLSSTASGSLFSSPSCRPPDDPWARRRRDDEDDPPQAQRAGPPWRPGVAGRVR